MSFTFSSDSFSCVFHFILGYKFDSFAYLDIIERKCLIQDVATSSHTEKKSISITSVLGVYRRMFIRIGYLGKNRGYNQIRYM